MPRLYSDLLSGDGGRYYFGLNAAVGGITNATPAALTLNGNIAFIQELSEAFRTPATALLTMSGPLATADPRLNPGVATLTLAAGVPGIQASTVITNALPPDYTDLAENPPTIVYIQTLTPVVAILTINYPPPNLTQGGNIVSITAGVATLTINGHIATIPFFAGSPAALSMSAPLPTIATTLLLEPESGSIDLLVRTPSISLPFTWIDDDPVSPSTWMDG